VFFVWVMIATGCSDGLPMSDENVARTGVIADDPIFTALGDRYEPDSGQLLTPASDGISRTPRNVVQQSFKIETTDLLATVDRTVPVLGDSGWHSIQIICREDERFTLSADKTIDGTTGRLRLNFSDTQTLLVELSAPRVGEGGEGPIERPLTRDMTRCS
jgi:hypothetical protein